MTNPGASLEDLTGALHVLRSAVSEASYPLPLPSAAGASATAQAVAAQVDDHALPRLGRLDAPLLVVVGGPTGAGKSTLINSLIRAPASEAGVLRPTTRAPVLVCNAADAAWFRGDRILPRHTRTSGPATGPDHLRVVTAPALPAGCAFLDTPDIDSVVHANRAAAGTLLGAADLWLFVTTAARYADAVPWDVLRAARDRGAVVALVLNRTAPDAMTEVAGYLTEMLQLHAIGGTPLFVLPETTPDGHGLLPEAVVAQVSSWFDALTGNTRARSAVVGQSLDGALATLPTAVAQIASAVDEQVVAAEALAEQVGVAYGAARASVEGAVRDGTLAQGEVLARWRAFVDSPEWRLRPSLVGRARQWWTTIVSGSPRAGRHLVAAVESSLTALVRSTIVTAGEQTYRSWRLDAAGNALLGPDAGPDLSVPAATSAQPGGTEDQVGRLVRQWRRDVRELIRHEAAGGSGRGWSPAVTAALPKVLVGAIARDLPAAAGEPDPPLAKRAREELLDRIWVLFDAEAARYLDRLAGVLMDRRQGRRLRDAAAQVERARDALATILAEEPEPEASAEPSGGPESMASPESLASPESPARAGSKSGKGARRSRRKRGGRTTRPAEAGT